MDFVQKYYQNLYDENGLSFIEKERSSKVVDNSIYLTYKKVESELGTFLFLIISITSFFIVRYIYQNHVLRPYAKSIGMRRQFIQRFLENGWYSLYYITFFTFGTYIYSKENWSLFPTTNIWEGWPLQPFSNLYRVYYLLELSFYLHCTIALFYETKRKDFYQMLTHHISTFFLVGASYWVRYHRIGLAILIIHNIADIFLYSAKAVNYVQKETKSRILYAITETLFVGFAVSFFLSRLLFFPFTLVRSTLTEVPEGNPLIIEANIALIVLICLHVFWFYLITRIIYAKFSKGDDVDDIRSDSEDEDGNPTKHLYKDDKGKNRHKKSE